MEHNNSWMIYCPGLEAYGITPIAIARFLRGSEDRELAEANAEFIVKACNSHDDLLEALKQIQHLAYVNDKGNPDKIFELSCQVIAKVEG